MTPLERLLILSTLPDNDKPENITFSMPLSIVEPSNKLVILGSVAGVLVTVVLLVALYAPHSCASFAPRRHRRTLPACTPPLLMQLRAPEARHREGQGNRGCGAEGRGQDGMGPRH